MSNENESMMGIMKLYELRSETTMRKARDWFAIGFDPESTQDILNVLTGDLSADFRMVSKNTKRLRSDRNQRLLKV